LCGPVAAILEVIQVGGLGEQSGGFGGEAVSVHLKELEEEAEVEAVKDVGAGEEGKRGTDLNALGHNERMREHNAHQFWPVRMGGLS
jgi:hypothetical protein